MNIKIKFIYYKSSYLFFCSILIVILNSCRIVDVEYKDEALLSNKKYLLWEEKLKLIDDLVENPERIRDIITTSNFKYNMNGESNNFENDSLTLNNCSTFFKTGFSIYYNYVNYEWSHDFHGLIIHHFLAVKSKVNRNAILYFIYIKWTDFWKLDVILDKEGWKLAHPDY